MPCETGPSKRYDEMRITIIHRDNESHLGRIFGKNVRPRAHRASNYGTALERWFYLFFLSLYKAVTEASFAVL